MANLPEMIQIILQKTEQGKLDWEKLGTASFVARLEGALLEVGRRTDGISYLNLRNQDNVVVESCTYNTLPSPLDTRLNVLHEAARRRAYGTDVLLINLKEQLDKL